MRPFLVVTLLSAQLSALLTGLSVAPTARAADPPVYVALGDSYASGVGTGDHRADASGCRRSAYAYPSLLAAERGYDLRFAACSGATTAHVQRHQLGALGEDTALVTLSIGGNDAGFAEVLTTCAAPWWLAACDPAVDLARRVVRDELPGRLRRLYAAVRDRAPRARVVVVGYPRLFMGDDCDLGTWFTRGEQQRLNATADLLDTRVAAAARAAGFAYADPTAAFTGHAVCDPAEWVNGLSLPVGESFHPNAAGHAEGLLPLVRAALDGAPAPRAAAPAPALRGRATRAGLFQPPDVRSPQARRAARRHGIDLDAWLAAHP